MERKTGRTIRYKLLSNCEPSTVANLPEPPADLLVLEHTDPLKRSRPKLQSLLEESLGTGDLIVVGDLTQLAHSIEALLGVIEKVLVKNAAIWSVSENVLVSKADRPRPGSETLDLIRGLVVFEKTLKARRRRQGIEAAKAAGRHLGRPRKISRQQRDEIVIQFRQGFSPTRIARFHGISRGSVYNIIGEAESPTEALASPAGSKSESLPEKATLAATRAAASLEREVDPALAVRLAAQLSDKYERKRNPVFEELVGAILRHRHRRYQKIKEQVREYTGYTEYKSGYLMTRIIPALQEAGIIDWSGDRGEPITWL